MSATARRMWLLGGLLGVGFLLPALLAPWLAPHDPFALDLGGALAPPDAAFPLGQDEQGADILSRLLYGARISLLVGLATVTVSAAVGIAVGLLAGYLGGWVEQVLMRLVDVLLAFPGLLLAIALVAVLGPGLANVVIALSALGWTGFARLVRGQVLSVKARDYVLAATALGVGDLRIMWAPHPAQHPGPGAGAGLLRHRRGDPVRGQPELPGPGGAARHAELGRHAGRRALRADGGAARVHLSRAGHHAGGAGLQPARRRPHRLARPEAARWVSPAKILIHHPAGGPAWHPARAVLDSPVRMPAHAPPACRAPRPWQHPGLAARVATASDSCPPMAEQQPSPEFRELTQDEVNLLALELIQQLQQTYEPGRDRVITPENVFQPARPVGRELLESFMARLHKPGSGVEGTAHLEHCLAELAAGRHVLFLAEHRGNLDVPSFAALLHASYPRAAEVLPRLIYIAGRKLNESSDFIKMFTEKYARLVIVPRRDLPPEDPAASEAERAEREAFLRNAQRINRAAFRELVRLKKAGHIFVLFPLGGRLKPGADNRPVRETTSYLSSFDTAYLISMDGNTLPPLPRMEDERPTQAKVVFRFGPPVDTRAFLADARQRFEAAQGEGRVAADADFEQEVVEHIMQMLEHLRTAGDYGPPIF